MSLGRVVWRFPATPAIGRLTVGRHLRQKEALALSSLGERRAFWSQTGHQSAQESTQQPSVETSHKPPPAPTRDVPSQSLLLRTVESAANTFVSILVLGLGFAIAGYGYHRYYKHLVLRKMKNTFRPGDPVLVLAALGKDMPLPPTAPDTYCVQRPEQEQVNAIVAGLDVGHYHLIIGGKGTGKTILLLEAMRRVDGDGVSMFEAHADIEIFRIRLGKALDYEFHEDYIGAHFSERGPRDTTALLDIERALNKLEKVALERRKEVGRPLVLIINQTHLIRDNDNGKDLFELLQQRAEHWAAANLATIVFNSDDYWVYERLKQLSTRMEVHSITDLPKPQALEALGRYRQHYFNEVLPHSVHGRPGSPCPFCSRLGQPMAAALP